MKERLINFETAKLANEKGFRLQSNPFGYITKFYNHNTKTLLAYGRTGKTDLSKAYYAPTQSLLQKWLREAHEIFVSVDVNFNVKIYYKDELHNEIFNFNSYEEALEVGLQESLKLIKV